jgi:hypothetical protein
MATTTNYGWTTPDDTDLVKDGAAAIRTLGSSVDTTTKNLNPETTLGDMSFRSATSNVNTRLAIGSSGQHLTVVAGVPAWATASDQTPLTTKGDLLGFSTLDARIPIGTNGHILTADSTESLGLKWAAPAGGGKVLQVVSGTNSTLKSIASTTMTDTNLTLNITPTSATSKVLVLITQHAYTSRSAVALSSGIRLLRDATAIYSLTENAHFLSTTAATTELATIHSIAYLDSPATTSATTYKTQGRVGTTANSQQVSFQLDSQPSSIVLLEIGA